MTGKCGYNILILASGNGSLSIVNNTERIIDKIDRCCSFLLAAGTDKYTLYIKNYLTAIISSSNSHWCRNIKQFQCLLGLFSLSVCLRAYTVYILLIYVGELVSFSHLRLSRLDQATIMSFSIKGHNN